MGAIEHSHSCVIDFLKLYIDNVDSWADLIPRAQLAYNLMVHDITGFPPAQIVFGHCPKTPLSYKLKNDPTTYLDYIKDLSKTLEQTQTLAGMNLIHSKL